MQAVAVPSSGYFGLLAFPVRGRVARRDKENFFSGALTCGESRIEALGAASRELALLPRQELVAAAEAGVP